MFQQALPDRFIIWLDVMFGALLLFFGVNIAAGVKLKEMVLGSLFLFVWSVGYLFIPLVNGYAEGLFGSWALLGSALLILFYRFRKKNKKSQT